MEIYVNQVIIRGNVGSDVDFRTFDNGDAVASFRVATSTGGYTKQDGTQVPERTQLHNIQVFGKDAPRAKEYVKKGGRVEIRGSIRYREYEKEGNKYYATDIVAESFECLAKIFNSGNKPPQPTAEDSPYYSETPQTAVAQPQQAVAQTPPPPIPPQKDDNDLPF